MELVKSRPVGVLNEDNTISCVSHNKSGVDSYRHQDCLSEVSSFNLKRSFVESSSGVGVAW